MQIFINITVTFFVMFWPVMLMMSPMMFDAPGSENNKEHVINMMLILGYPVYIFIALWLLGVNYFGVNSLKLSIISGGIVLASFSIFGYFSMLSNLVKGINNTGYSVTSNQVYYSGNLIEGADSESFTILDNERHYRTSLYARDRHHFYYDGAVVTGANPDNLRKKRINGDTYWLNASQVIHDDKILPGAHPDHFYGFEGYDGWTCSRYDDVFLVFSYGEPLPAVDPASFTPLNDFIAKDRAHVFERNRPILAGSDAASFELLEDHNFGRDRNRVYYLATSEPFAIDNADPASFVVLDRGYLKDKNRVYLVHQYESVEALPEVDVSSFEVTRYDDDTRSEARDKDYYYYDGKIVAERATP